MACQECRKDCFGGNCSDVKEAGDVSVCTSCLETFYLKGDKTCEQCSTGCKVCSGLGTCSVCAKSTERPQRPDAGVCAECLAPNSLGFEGNNEVCGPVPGVKAQASQEVIAVNNRISVEQLCQPTDISKKAQEKVGALLVIGEPVSALGASQIKQIREMINQASNVSEADFGKMNRNHSSISAIYANIAGTDEGLAGFSGLKVFKGNSTLSYVCINAFNVQSAIKQLKVVNNASKNKNYRFRVSFNKTLSPEQLENLTCAFVSGTKISPISRLRNQLGRACNDSVKARRMLQEASSGDVSFTVEANQLEDDWDAVMQSNLGVLNETVANFSSREGLQVLGGIQMSSFQKGTVGAVPALSVTVRTNQTLITLNVVSDVEAVFSYGLTTKKGSLNLTELLQQQIKNNDTILVGRSPLTPRVNQTINITELSPNTDYILFHHSESVAESPKSAGLLNISVRTNSTSASSSLTNLIYFSGKTAFVILFLFGLLITI